MLRLSLRRRRQLLPWLFLGPGLLWLIVFFAIPLVNQVNVSLQTGDSETGYAFDWDFSTYTEAIKDYHVQFIRSIGYAATATVLCLIIGFPLAYFTAFKAGRYKNLILLLIVLPFFTSYVLRTVAWQLILSDSGWVVERLRDVGLLGEDGRLLASRTAVIAGITYNFLPFMILPLYVSLEKIDRRLIEAATDLYASRVTAFRRITLPLALPGIFAGSLLTFIPATGDFINAALLGTPRQYMIGNVIQSKFITILDYPTAAALSFILMTFILIGVFLYARVLGTQQPHRGGVLGGIARRQDPRRGASRSGRGSRCSTSSSRSSSSSCSRSTTTRAASTSPGRASRSSHWADPFANPDLGDRAQELAADRRDLDGARDRARDVHGAGARALRLPRPRRRRPVRLPPARDPRGRARRRAARRCS